MRSSYEKQLKELQTTYNTTHTQDPIESINKEAIKAGSIGQVYSAKTKSGKTVVLKMVKPNLNEAYLKGYLPYIYYQRLLTSGTKPQEKQFAAKAAQESVEIMAKETRPEQEAQNTKKMHQWAQKLSPISFNVPEVLAYSKEGLVLPFVGDKDFVDLDSKTQVQLKNKIGPDLARFLLLASAKPLDIHDGNMRSGKAAEPVQWLDHGRQFNISDANYEKMLNLLTATLSAPTSDNINSPWENAILQEDVRNHLKSLLELNPSANQQALTSLAKLETDMDKEPKSISAKIAKKAELQDKNTAKNAEVIKSYTEKILSTADETKVKDEFKQLSEALQPFENAVKLLSQTLGQPHATTKKSNALFSRPVKLAPVNVPLSVLNAWASCAQNIPGFAASQLPQQDTQQYKQKMKGFLQPYIEGDNSVKPADSTEKWEKEDEKLKALANGLADSLLAQTGIKLEASAREQLLKNMQKGLREDIIY